MADYSISTKEKNPALAAALREMDAKKHRSPWRRRAMISGAALIAIFLIVGAAWAIKAKRASDQKSAILASNDRQQIRDAIDSGKITREEMWDAREKEREARDNKQLDEFFALAIQADRNKYLDKIIDEREKFRKEREARAATRPTTRPTRPGSTTQPTTQPWGPGGMAGGGFDPARQLARAQGGDPVKKAERAAFREAMRERMAQRGISSGAGGAYGGMGGRGGGGGGGRGRGG